MLTEVRRVSPEQNENSNKEIENIKKHQTEIMDRSFDKRGVLISQPRGWHGHSP